MPFVCRGCARSFHEALDFIKHCNFCKDYARRKIELKARRPHVNNITEDDTSMHVVTSHEEDIIQQLKGNTHKDKTSVEVVACDALESVDMLEGPLQKELESICETSVLHQEEQHRQGVIVALLDDLPSSSELKRKQVGNNHSLEENSSTPKKQCHREESSTM